MDDTPTTPSTRAPVRRWLFLALAAGALLAASMLALAQAETPGDADGEPPAAAAERWLRARAVHAALPRVSQALRRGTAPERADAFAHWLAAEPAALPVVPGLVGRVPEGTEVRVHLYDGDPADGGELLASLGYVAGSDDLAAFHDDLREAAAGATHAVYDVLGRTVALPTAEDDVSD